MKLLELSKDERRTLREMGISFTSGDANASAGNFAVESGADVTADCG